MENPFNLIGKIAVVTGGGSGIGEQICKVFADAGATVCVLDINEHAAERVAQDINEKEGTAFHYKADVSNQSLIVDIFQAIARKFGRIDVLVNNAGIAHIGKLDTTTEQDFDRILSVNVKGVYNGMYAAIPHMKRQNSGVILNMGSVASDLGIPDRFAYSMSKGAVLTMTYSVAKDYLDFHIRCNSIAPARVHTPFVDGYLSKNYPGREAEVYEQLSKTQPIGRMGKPVEIAQLALYLCSDAAGFITGTNFPIDGGFIRLNT